MICIFQPNWNNLHTRSISIGNLFRFVYIYYELIQLFVYTFSSILVVVVKTDDTSCHKTKEIGIGAKKSSSNLDSRMKNFTLSISKKISYNEYLIATFGAFGIFVGFYILVLLISCVLCIKDYR